MGNAILYETVLTILETEADNALRVLAVNLLGRFLSNKDNNIRYVALTTLNKTITIDHASVQRHRNTVLECLHDADISIRRRALDLAFALVNEQNVRFMTRELLAFLEVADAEFKPDMTTRICRGADRYAPNSRWHIDTILRVLRLAGAHVREEILSNLIHLIARTTELHAYTVQKLYVALRADLSQEALVLAGLWALGELGDILLSPGPDAQDPDLTSPPREEDVVELVEKVLDGPYSTTATREYGLTALIKLVGRFQDPGVLERIRRRIQSYSRDPVVEVQERAVEYGKILDFPELLSAVLERMPIMEGREDLRASSSPPGSKSSKRASGASRRKGGQTSSSSSTDQAGSVRDCLLFIGCVRDRLGQVNLFNLDTPSHTLSLPLSLPFFPPRS